MLLWYLCVVLIAMYTNVHAQPIVVRKLATIQSPQDIVALVPQDTGYIQAAADIYLDEITQLLTKIISIPDSERTFANTVKAFDYCMSLSDATIFKEVLLTLTALHPQAAMREAATTQVSRIQGYFVDIRADKALYNALKAYATQNAPSEALTTEQLYFLDTIIADFERTGLNLPDEQLDRVRSLNKEIADVALAFNHNVDEDASYILANKEELNGLSPEWIAHLKQDEQGNYIIGVDQPTVTHVMAYAAVSDTRKRLYIAYKNRAYPANDQLLCTLIAKRHELAQLLGFASYAAFDLENQMVKSPERATTFIYNLIERAAIKEQKEFEELCNYLPEGVSLSRDGKLYPWDIAYVRNYIKQQLYTIDEQALAEYFPVEHTLQGLLDIYAQFFSLRFTASTIDGLWVDNLTLLTVYNKNETEPLGYVILDLYPRADKYGHAACQQIIAATYTPDGQATRAVAQVMTNFPTPQGDKPALFKRSDVRTFFHEFGHALHALLGRTTLASTAGLAIKIDFAEMPSQMLEQWLQDEAILKSLSCHYITNEQLPDSVIDNIRKLNHFDSGSWVQQQCFYAAAALQFFDAAQPITNAAQLWHDVSTTIRTHEVSIPEDHMYASFVHLTEYGPKYYGYLWSKVFALDLFSEIKCGGLLNPIAGARYVEQVIGRGGSADPEDLLINFLGRSPNDKAFFNDMGI